MALRRKHDRIWKGDLHNSAEEIVPAESNTCNSKEPNNMEEVSNILERVASDSSALPETIHALADQSLDPVDPAVAQEVDLDLDDFEDEIAAAESERHDSKQPNSVSNIFERVVSDSSALPQTIYDVREQSLDHVADMTQSEDSSNKRNNFDRKRKHKSLVEDQDIPTPSKKKLQMTKSRVLEDLVIPSSKSSNDLSERVDTFSEALISIWPSDSDSESEGQIERKKDKKKEGNEGYRMNMCRVSIHPIHSARWQTLHPRLNPSWIANELKEVTKNKLEEEQERAIRLERDLAKKNQTISKLKREREKNDNTISELERDRDKKDNTIKEQEKEMAKKDNTISEQEKEMAKKNNTLSKLEKLVLKLNSIF